MRPPLFSNPITKNNLVFKILVVLCYNIPSTGKNAKESVLKNLSKIDAEVLHFAAHGRFDKRDPLKSALLLAKDSN
jgi:hypothetical protein